MNRGLQIIAMVTPLIALSFIIQQIVILVQTPIAVKSAYRSELDTLASKVALAEKVSLLHFEQQVEPNSSIESPFSSNQPEPVAVVPRPEEPSIDTFTREHLTVQGILKGTKPMAVLVDKNGTTYIVKSGEILFNRKVVSIGTSGVILSDKSGNETLAIP